MTTSHQARNASILRKIEAYTTRATASPEAAREALRHEREVLGPKCDGCGHPLLDGGPVGYFCGADDCTYEKDMALENLRRLHEQAERKEYERLKAKYG